MSSMPAHRSSRFEMRKRRMIGVVDTICRRELLCHCLRCGGLRVLGMVTMFRSRGTRDRKKMFNKSSTSTASLEVFGRSNRLSFKQFTVLGKHAAPETIIKFLPYESQQEICSHESSFVFFGESERMSDDYIVEVERTQTHTVKTCDI